MLIVKVNLNKYIIFFKKNNNINIIAIYKINNNNSMYNNFLIWIKINRLIIYFLIHPLNKSIINRIYHKKILIKINNKIKIIIFMIN